MWSSRAVTLGAVALVLGGTGCIAPGDEPTTSVVAQLVCDGADVGDGYLLQVTGSFTPGDIAALAADQQDRKDALARAGFRGGHFSYWKQIVGHPPFDPPENILCEAMEFVSEDGARAFVRDFDPAAGHELPGLLPLPDDETRITEETRPEDDPAGRTFAISSEGDPVDIHVSVAVSARGRFVQTTYAGGRRDDPGSTKQAEAVHSRLLERSLPLIGCDEPRATSC